MNTNPVSLITGIFDPNSAKKRAPFELRAGSFVQQELEVISFRGRERVNDTYVYEVTFATQVDPDAIHATLLGAQASLTIKSPGNDPRIIQGVVSSLEGHGGVPGEQGSDYHRYRLVISPKLWLLKRHRVNRVFQGKTVKEIVEVLLDALDLDPTETRWRTVDSEYPPLPFVYQRNESDFELFRRVLASAGIFFYFEHATALSGAGSASPASGPSDGAPTTPATSDGVTVLNFARRESDTPPLAASSATTLPGAGEFGAPVAAVAPGSATSSGTLGFDDGVGTDSSSERVFEFALTKRLRAQTLQLLERNLADHDSWIGQGAPPDSTNASPSSDPGPSDPAGPAGTPAPDSGSDPFGQDTTAIDPALLREERYQVDPGLSETTQDPQAIDDPQMARELARRRRHYLEARGKTDCRRIGAGYRFTLTEHTIPALDDEYTLTALSCAGHNPDFVKKADFVYRASFKCIPSTAMPLPPRPKKRPKLGLEVAQVVAYSDILGVPWLESSGCGYVKIRFRWDVDVYGAPAGALLSGTDDDAAIWVPAVQPWAGAGYGAQFVPREGMEVLVGFLEHQGERPVILGCLYSGANPPPWSEQTDQQKVGIRSQTRPANGGYSEISIDDRQGGEVVTITAQKDLEETVLNDRTTSIGNDESISVTDDRSLSVGGDDVIAVAGDASRTVTGDDFTTVQGDSTTAITGESETTVSGDVSLTVLGDTQEDLQGDQGRTVGGDVTVKVEGQTQYAFSDDYTERHLGHRTIIVGSGDAHRAATIHVEGPGRAYASKTMEIEVLESLTITCGKSQILVSSGGITFSSPNITLVSQEVDMNLGKLAVATSGDLALAGDTVTLQTMGGKVALDDSSANVSGMQVNLGQGSGSNPPPSSQQPTVTTIQLNDSQGNPRANARVLLRTGGPNGEQRMTVLDANGQLEIVGTDQYEVFFPDDPKATSS